MHIITVQYMGVDCVHVYMYCNTKKYCTIIAQLVHYIYTVQV